MRQKNDGRLPVRPTKMGFIRPIRKDGGNWESVDARNGTDISPCCLGLHSPLSTLHPTHTTRITTVLRSFLKPVSAERKTLIVLYGHSQGVWDSSLTTKGEVVRHVRSEHFFSEAARRG